ncbi:SGNH hydrolase [Cystobasidium minutum MCA 4210]|uniref:SGNH hydrolase n=1 Tax=Cystobasidium minutum MCA 4210 TaxID=1397322 RepID=UPI0034D012F0|eukprot:jgi/Rhomi1/99892/CE99891_2301
MSIPTVYPEWMLFGDSITQQSFSAGGYGQWMADNYQRRVDIINRGYGGYNTEWALRILPYILPETSANKPLKAINLWFGANDATLPMRDQSIPVERFKANLNKMIDMLQDEKSPHYSPSTVITLFSCPPICKAQREEHVLAEWGPGIKLDRDPARTKTFAEAAGEVAKERKVGFVNVYAAMMAAAGPNPDENLRQFFWDGLHLSAAGYKVVSDAFFAYLQKEHQDLLPDNLPKVFPLWDSIDPKNPDASFPPN